MILTRSASWPLGSTPKRHEPNYQPELADPFCQRKRERIGPTVAGGNISLPTRLSFGLALAPSTSGRYILNPKPASKVPHLSRSNCPSTLSGAAVPVPSPGSPRSAACGIGHSSTGLRWPGAQTWTGGAKPRSLPSGSVQGVGRYTGEGKIDCRTADLGGYHSHFQLPDSFMSPANVFL